MAQNDTPAKVATSAGLGPGPEARPLVDRLRQQWPETPHHRDALRREAADEIERLSAAYRYIEEHAMRLMNERDAATSAERDCRTCTNWTQRHRSYLMHCSAALRCVAGSSYQRHGVVQLWEAAPVDPAPF